MSEQQLFAGMGSLSGLMNEKPIVDLSWLEIVPGSYDNIPSHNNPHDVIPQLQEAWSLENHATPTSFIPNQVLSGKAEIQEIGPEKIEPVVMVAKKAMMLGMRGPDVLGYLRERFPDEQLKAASSELRKVASEQGLMGTVYVDLGAFETAREASSFLGQQRIRLASYAVGTPLREPNFLTEAGIVRDLGKPHVASVTYTPELLARYASELKDSDLIERNASVSTKEELQQAIVAGKRACVKERTLEAHPYQSLTVKQASELLDLVSANSKQASAERASEERWASVRPVLAHMQTEMLKGRIGPSLRTAMTSKYPERLIKENAPEISRIASLQGLMGKLYADVSLYASTDEAVQAIRTASVRPSYIVATRDTGDGRLDRVASATGCAPMPKEGPSIREASALVNEMRIASRLPDQSVAALNARLASGDAPVEVIRDAHLAASTYVPEEKVGGQAGSFLSGGTPVAAPSTAVDKEAVKTAAMAALSRGYGVSKVQEKIASILPPAEAVGTIRNALASMDIVPAASLERCTLERYNLGRNTRIACAAKCGSCVHSIGGFCSKQASKLETGVVAKAASIDLDLSAQYNLHTASLDASAAPQAKFVQGPTDFFGVKTTLDGFFRA